MTNYKFKNFVGELRCLESQIWLCQHLGPDFRHLQQNSQLSLSEWFLETKDDMCQKADDFTPFDGT
jgi:hypothetical protein